MENELKINYFSHDTNSSSDPKLINLRINFGWKAIGMYWALIEALHKEDSGELPLNLIHTMILDFYLQEEIREKRNIIDEASNFEETLYANALLVVLDNGYATSGRVRENIELIKNRSDNARRSATIRWENEKKSKEKQGKNKDNANALQNECERNAIKVNKSKVNKSKVNNIYTHYQLKINKQSRLTNKGENKINTRLQEFSEEDLKKAIDNFSSDSWWMKNNAHRGVAWFFHSEERIDGFINLKSKKGAGLAIIE